jgi:hypothetical protein
MDVDCVALTITWMGFEPNESINIKHFFSGSVESCHLELLIKLKIRIFFHLTIEANY